MGQQGNGRRLGEYEAFYKFGMSSRKKQGRQCAVRVADERNCVQPERVDERSQIVGVLDRRVTSPDREWHDLAGSGQSSRRRRRSRR